MTDPERFVDDCRVNCVSLFGISMIYYLLPAEKLKWEKVREAGRGRIHPLTMVLHIAVHQVTDPAIDRTLLSMDLEGIIVLIGRVHLPIAIALVHSALVVYFL